jgi:hypothetical protein
LTHQRPTGARPQPHTKTRTHTENQIDQMMKLFFPFISSHCHQLEISFFHILHSMSRSSKRMSRAAAVAAKSKIKQAVQDYDKPIPVWKKKTKKQPKIPSPSSSIMAAHCAHQRRRFLRQINSSGPMLLSRRSSYRMTMTDNASTPNYSPILAETLYFTPVSHLP